MGKISFEHVRYLEKTDKQQKIVLTEEAGKAVAEQLGLNVPAGCELHLIIVQKAAGKPVDASREPVGSEPPQAAPSDPDEEEV